MPATITILTAVLGYTWFLQPRTPASFVIVPVVLVVAAGCWKALGSGEWGLDFRGLLPSLLVTSVFTAIAAGIFLAIGNARGTLHEDRNSLASLGLLFVWGAAQQWILQTVVLREAQHATSRKLGVIVAAAIFATVHLPNPFLTLVTLIGALAWCAIYDRYPNILPLALSHAAATLVILHAFNDDVTGRLRVGYAYLMLR